MPTPCSCGRPKGCGAGRWLRRIFRSDAWFVTRTLLWAALAAWMVAKVWGPGGLVPPSSSP